MNEYLTHSGRMRWMIASGVIVLCLAGFLLCAWILPEHHGIVMRPVWRTTGTMDATAFRAGAKLLGTQGMYDVESVGDLQERDTGSKQHVRMFLRLPWYALLTRWLAYPSYETAMALWKCLLVVAAIAFIALWKGQRMFAALAVGWSLPFAASVEQGQDTIWFLLFLAGAARFAQRGQLFAAGLVLSLCTIKPHFLLLLPLALATRTRLRILYGLAAGCAVLVGISCLAQGTAWISSFYSLLSNSSYHSGIPFMPSIAGLFPLASASQKMTICAALTSISAPIVYRVATRISLEIGIYLSILLSMLFSPHAYVHDTLVVLPLILSAWSIVSTTGRIAAVFLCLPVVGYATALWTPFLGPIFFAPPTILIAYQVSRGTVLEGAANGP